MSTPTLHRRTEEASIDLEARYLASLSPEERAAIFIDLERTMEAILTGLPAGERARRRALSRSLDPRPTPWWKNLRPAARPTSDGTR